MRLNFLSSALTLNGTLAPGQWRWVSAAERDALSAPPAAAAPAAPG